MPGGEAQNEPECRVVSPGTARRSYNPVNAYDAPYVHLFLCNDISIYLVITHYSGALVSLFYP